MIRGVGRKKHGLRCGKEARERRARYRQVNVGERGGNEFGGDGSLNIGVPLAHASEPGTWRSGNAGRWGKRTRVCILAVE